MLHTQQRSRQSWRTRTALLLALLFCCELALLLLLVIRRMAGQVLQSHEYTLVRMGQRAGAREGDGTTREYEYDALGRLADERVQGGASPGHEEACAYDAVGNHTGWRRTDTTGTTTTLLAYDTGDRLLSVSGVHPFNLAPSSSQK